MTQTSLIGGSGVEPGLLVRVRQRTYLVKAVLRTVADAAPVVDLACIDDDDPR